MTKAELLKALERFDDNAEIEIVVRQYDKNHPVAYVGISKRDCPVTESPAYRGPGIPSNVRINIDLPENMRTRVLKS
jgi:hypothetical protein